MTDKTPVMQARKINMAFGGVQVLTDVDLSIYPGEVHGLIGENGAGKSTLVKILAGVHQPKSGEVLLNNKVVNIPDPHTATDMGIALIHQEPLTFPDLDVAENIFIGHQPKSGRLARIDWRTMYARSAELLNSLGVELDPRTKVRGLSVADQQMVEMAGALSRDATVLLMDEPTAALTPSEVEDLFVIIRRLREQGTAIVFISHRLEEIFAICDRITILRDGRWVGERRSEETTTDEIIQMMVGRPLSALFNKGDSHSIGAPMLEVEGLSRIRKFQDVSFKIHAGEIVGMAGLVGAGRTDVARALFGTLNIDKGTVRIQGREVHIKQPSDALAHGMVYVPEDRQHNGLLMPMSVSNNITLAALEKISTGHWLRKSREDQFTQDYVEKLRIMLRSVDQPVRELSGGNQQKAVLAKWLLAEPKIILLDEPTRGIDIGAKSEVHRLIGELASHGLAILMISSEMPEILAMSDRIIVMREGYISGHFTREEATAERIIAAATGQVLQEA
jgi:rhamnose transport system ATP-binding protein